MIAAVLSICLHAHPAQCAVQHFRIAPSACHLPAYPAEVPDAAGWREVVVRVTCHVSRRHS
ncbi:MAG: hypothetical protein WA150_07245 [Methylovirgula sp.]